jgi:hypothetical protein
MRFQLNILYEKPLVCLDRRVIQLAQPPHLVHLGFVHLLQEVRHVVQTVPSLRRPRVESRTTQSRITPSLILRRSVVIGYDVE